MSFELKKNKIFEIQINNETDFFLTHETIKPLLKGQTLFLLEGDLAAGKTTFVKSLFPEVEVTSPTFSIHNSYQFSQIKLNVEHFDLYRLNSEDELASTGLWDVFGEKDRLVFIEWPQRVNEDLWPLNWTIFKILIHHNEQNTSRTFSLFQITQGELS